MSRDNRQLCRETRHCQPDQRSEGVFTNTETLSVWPIPELGAQTSFQQWGFSKPPDAFLAHITMACNDGVPALSLARRVQSSSGRPSRSLSCRNNTVVNSPSTSMGITMLRWISCPAASVSLVGNSSTVLT